MALHHKDTPGNAQYVLLDDISLSASSRLFCAAFHLVWILYSIRLSSAMQCFWLSPSSWTPVHDTNYLRNCNGTSLFDANIYTSVEGPKATVNIRACSNGTSLLHSTASVVTPIGEPYICGEASQTVHTQRDINLLQWGNNTQTDLSTQIISATSQLSDYLKRQESCAQPIIFSQSGDVIVGVYVSANIQPSSVSNVLTKLEADAKTAPLGTSQLAAQLCDTGYTTQEILGVFIDTTGSLPAVLNALQKWNEATCLTNADYSSSWTGAPIDMISYNTTVISPSVISSSTSRRSSIHQRRSCKYVQVASGDGCWSLAKKCGITQAKLQQYNPTTNFCNTIQVGQYVCYSPGSLLDFSPQPYTNGSCVPYIVKTNDTCSAIASAHTMTVTELGLRNSNTWGWAGCQYLYVGQIICLSAGKPPMPAALRDAVCGPQVPNTAAPADMSKLAELNPCPLNACCDIWGKCGVTTDFCIADPADTGAPGTAQPGTNGCISNCRTDIVNNASPPSSFIRVGYYEAWNYQRPCLHIGVGNLFFNSLSMGSLGLS